MRGVLLTHLCSNFEFHCLPHRAHDVQGPLHVGVAVLGLKRPDTPLQGLQFRGIGGLYVSLVSVQLGGFDAASLDVLVRRVLEEGGHGRGAASNADVLEQGNELLVILSEYLKGNGTRKAGCRVGAAVDRKAPR